MGMEIKDDLDNFLKKVDDKSALSEINSTT